MLRVKGLDQYYGQSHTLWDLNFEVPAQSCTCVLGRNGVGKTTLMESIVGLAPKVIGSIDYDGVNLVNKPAEMRAQVGIAYIPQGRQIFAQLTVEENIRTGLFARKNKTRHIPSEIYDLFPVLRDMRRRRGGDLSGGQQQQLAIARALVLEPKVLLMDEPAEGIQPSIVQEIANVIVELNRQRDITIVLVEQKLPFARSVGTHYVVLDRGRLQAQGEMPGLSDEIVQKYLSV